MDLFDRFIERIKSAAENVQVGPARETPKLQQMFLGRSPFEANAINTVQRPEGQRTYLGTGGSVFPAKAQNAAKLEALNKPYISPSDSLPSAKIDSVLNSWKK